MDDGLLVAQNKSLTVSNSFLFYSYQIISSFLDRFSLKLEHGKTEIFHFLRFTSLFNPPPLDLSPLGGPILQPKNSWRYLDFIFDRKLTFHIHIDFYANKAISMVKCMKLLGNSTCGLISQQKCLLYRSCVLPIVVMGHWTLTIFFLFSFIFSDFTFLFLYFIRETMKKARDKEVTWQVTWCDIISLEHSRRVWKMMSGHLEYTWWPWVRSEVDMRMKHGL